MYGDTRTAKDRLSKKSKGAALTAKIEEKHEKNYIKSKIKEAHKRVRFEDKI